MLHWTMSGLMLLNWVGCCFYSVFCAMLLSFCPVFVLSSVCMQVRFSYGNGLICRHAFICGND